MSVASEYESGRLNFGCPSCSALYSWSMTLPASRTDTFSVDCDTCGQRFQVSNRAGKEAHASVPTSSSAAPRRCDWVGLEHLPRLLGLLAMVGLFAVVNVFLWFGQYFLHSSERKELEQLKVRLQALRVTAQNQEDQLNREAAAVEQLRSSVTECQTDLSVFEASAVGGSLPPKEYVAYERTLNVCNARIDALNSQVDKYSDLSDLYDKSVAGHNALIPRANELSKIIGTKYLIVPVPSLRGSKSGGRH